MNQSTQSTKGFRILDVRVARVFTPSGLDVGRNYTKRNQKKKKTIGFRQYSGKNIYLQNKYVHLVLCVYSLCLELMEFKDRALGLRESRLLY